MPTGLSLLQLNIEQSKHLDRILPFLTKERPEVMCAQELQEQDVKVTGEALDAHHVFVPMAKRSYGNYSYPEGVGIFSRYPFTKTNEELYAGHGGEITVLDLSNPDQKYVTQGYKLLVCEIQKENEVFRVATTHFPWTPMGSTNDFQREALESLLKILKGLGEFILCGDFNAPRGKEIFDTLASHYTDNIPTEYSSSIDGEFHRSGPLELMVDGIFSTPGYKVSGVQRISGLSDHCGFTATIETAYAM